MVCGASHGWNVVYLRESKHCQLDTLPNHIPVPVKTAKQSFIWVWLSVPIETTVSKSYSPQFQTHQSTNLPRISAGTARDGHEGQLRGHASHRQTGRDEFTTQLQLGRYRNIEMGSEKKGCAQEVKDDESEVSTLNSPFL